MAVYEQTVLLEQTSCCVCGTRFAVDKVIMENRRNRAGSIYCPNGHCIGWKESAADRVRKELTAQLEAERRKRESAERGESFAINAKNAAERKHKQLEKRVKNGVCPCCHRSFLNVHRHIKTKHPDFAAEAA